jgi:hypothetical protein
MTHRHLSRQLVLALTGHRAFDWAFGCMSIVRNCCKAQAIGRERLCMRKVIRPLAESGPSCMHQQLMTSDVFSIMRQVTASLSLSV